MGDRQTYLSKRETLAFWAQWIAGSVPGIALALWWLS